MSHAVLSNIAEWIFPSLDLEGTLPSLRVGERLMGEDVLNSRMDGRTRDGRTRVKIESTRGGLLSGVSCR